ncbi:hypothetical protein [uncultured Shewanella sp.]|uniref:hypothetical protein n=1 Tax=uncultured Shewanella sp. TaxID=173975 RepID=UPI00261FB0AD|nr:hypothetical protein [uncultured Shewanella sp.]
MNDNRPTEQESNKNAQPTIFDLESKIYEHSSKVDEALTFTRIVKEHFEAGYDINSEESLHCINIFERNIKELSSHCEELSNFAFELRPKKSGSLTENETH